MKMTRKDREVLAAALPAVIMGVLLFLWYKTRFALGPFVQRTLIGDSLAVGLMPHLRALGTVGPPLAAAPPKEGTTLTQWLERSLPAGAYLVSLGTNDMAGSGLTADMIRRMDAKLGNAIWLIPPPMVTLPKYAETASTIRENARTVEPPADLPRAADKIHLPPKGYAQWAEAVDRELRGR